MIDTIIFGVPASALVIALVGITRVFINDKRWYPIISIIYGIFIAWGGSGFVLAGIGHTLLGGIVLGLASAGLFSTGKSGIKLTVGKIKKMKEKKIKNEE